MIKNKTKNINFLQILFILIIVFIILLLVIIPDIAIDTFLQGTLIWATKILPALLPFFILTNLLSYTYFSTSIGKLLSPITNKLYGVGGVAGYIYIMSIMSGYPVGAKLTSDMYINNIISSKQAQTITSFTSTSGPLFIIGTVGIGFFGSQKLGIIILVSHFISAILNGFLYRNKEKSNNIDFINRKTSTNFISDSMTNGITSIMIVGGFIALFYMILSLLNSLNAFNFLTRIIGKFGVSESISSSIISGFIEVTTGALNLSHCGLSIEIAGTILSFLVSFGGLSIHAQAYCFLKNFNMPYIKFLLQKITHAIISASVTFLIFLII